MTNNAYYSGFYYWMGMILKVRDLDGQLVAALPGVPAGYEIVLEPVETDCFEMQGGPINGGKVVFVRSEINDIIAMRVESMELAKISYKTAEDLPVTDPLIAPDLNLTPAKKAAFTLLLETLLEKANGDWVVYDLPYPKHEFVQYVTEQDVVIFHGSNHDDIDLFTPIRKSIELHDETGRGNLQAVYGTDVGLWAMFFAVVDRANIRGSIRNGVMFFHNRLGEPLAVFNFSINQDQLAEKPWRDGTLYFLPRDTFTQQMLTEKAYSNEWTSGEVVQPYAKLHLLPEDFPFLESVGGHDDGELLRLNKLGKEIREAAQYAKFRDDRFTVTLAAGTEAQLSEYIELQKIYMPAASFTIKLKEKEIVLEMAALPPAFRQVLGEEYADLLLG